MLAQSCLAPGFFTLASNMITASDLKLGKEMPRWKQEYLRTSNKVILAETLSPTFVGMTFQEVAHICFATLNLVLVAVEARNRAVNKLSHSFTLPLKLGYLSAMIIFDGRFGASAFNKEKPST